MKEKEKGLAGREPTTYGFEGQRLSPTPLRPVGTYTLYYRREETKYIRSAWCSGRALAFKTIGRGFAPRQSLSFSNVDVGDAFQFMNHIMSERYTCEKKSARRWREANPLSLVLNSSDIGHGFAPRQSLSFSHVDVGDAFQFINHISAVCLQPALCLLHT